MSWVANLCFTVRAENEVEVNMKLDKLNAVAKRLGIPEGFTDWSEEDKDVQN